MLVYHPQGGLSNCLFGLSSAALLATAMCRRFGISWGSKVNRQAGASFFNLFERPDGVAFLNESEGRELMTTLNGTTSGPCMVQLNTNWNKSRAVMSLVLDAASLASRCPVLHVRSNMYYAPVLERDTRVARAGLWMRMRGLSCSSDRARAVSRSDGAAGVPYSRHIQDVPYFAAISKHLFKPHASVSARADAASVRTPSEAVVGVHVRSTILLALHKDKRDAACKKGKAACEQILSTYGFLECVAKVRNASARGGYETSRVYIAADNAMVREEALRAFEKDDVLPTPSYLYAGHEMRGKMVTTRGAVATAGAVDEMLLLARTDAVIVWDLTDSTYSAAAASWAAHRAGGQRVNSTSARPWLGVYVVSRGCQRIPDADVDPPTHKQMMATGPGAEHTPHTVLK